MQEQITQLQNRVNELEQKLKDIGDVSQLDIALDRALVARGFVKATIPIYNGSRSVWVAPISGGSPTVEVVFNSGFITSIN